MSFVGLKVNFRFEHFNGLFFCDYCSMGIYAYQFVVKSPYANFDGIACKSQYFFAPFPSKINPSYKYFIVDKVIILGGKKFSFKKRK